MKLKNMMYGIAGICLILSSCGHDNYATPDGGVKGTITNAITNAAIQTEQPNGIKIRLLEEKYGSGVQPIDFWCKSDGSFENSNVFSGKYKVIPIEGAFFPADTLEVNVNGLTEVEFKVTPFLTVTATVTSATGRVITVYKISRDKIGDKIIQCKSLVSAYPSVSNTINEFSKTHDISDDPDMDILSKQYTDTITDLISGSTYYVRVAARTSNANNKYNYSEIVKLQIP